MGFLGKIFYNTGKASATRPWTSIFIGLIIVLVGSLGFINFQSTVSAGSDDTRANLAFSRAVPYVT